MTRRTTVAIAGIAGLFALVSIGAWAIGSAIPPSVPGLAHDPVAVDPERPIPAVLYGDWVLDTGAGDPRVPATSPTIDLDAAVLIRRPGGVPVDWAGRAVAFSQIDPRTGELTVRSSGPCGDGRYRVSLPDPATGAVRFFLHAIDDPCGGRSSILEAPMGWVRPDSTDLVAGRIYGSFGFSEPFHFRMSAMDASLSSEKAAVVRRWGTSGGLRMGMGCCWTGILLDDQPVNVDVCDYTLGTLADIPSTPKAVGAWLRASPQMTVSDPVELTVDGRTAFRFDTIARDPCRGREGAMIPPEFDIGTRVYAIPTGHDTIIYSIWSDAGSRAGVEAGADELVRSMTFDRAQP